MSYSVRRMRENQLFTATAAVAELIASKVSTLPEFNPKSNAFKYIFLGELKETDSGNVALRGLGMNDFQLAFMLQ